MQRHQNETIVLANNKKALKDRFKNLLQYNRQSNLVTAMTRHTFKIVTKIITDNILPGHIRSF